MAENTINFLINLYLESYAYRQLKKTTKRQYLYYLNQLNLRFGDEKMAMLDDRLIYRRFTDIVETMACDTRRSAAYFQSVIKIVIKWGYQKGYLEKDHSALLSVKIERSRKIDNVWRADHIMLVKKNASPSFRNLIFFLLETGLRQSDAIRIRVTEHLKQHRDGRSYFFLQQQKIKGHNPTKGMLTVFMTDRLKAWFDKQKTGKDGYLLTTPNGEPWSVENIARTWKIVKTRAGLKGSPITLHGLRKNAVLNLMNAGCSHGQIAAIIGWDLKSVTDILDNHYYVDRTNVAIEAIEKLNKHAKEKEIS